MTFAERVNLLGEFMNHRQIAAVLGVDLADVADVALRGAASQAVAPVGFVLGPEVDVTAANAGLDSQEIFPVDPSKATLVSIQATGTGGSVFLGSYNGHSWLGTLIGSVGEYGTMFIVGPGESYTFHLDAAELVDPSGIIERSIG